MRQFLRSRTFKIAAIILGVIGLYAWFGFAMAPKSVRTNGVVNLTELSPKSSAPPPPPEPKKSELPSLWIQLFTVSNGNLGYEDLSRRVPYSNEFHPVAFTLKDFKTTPQ